MVKEKTSILKLNCLEEVWELYYWKKDETKTKDEYSTKYKTSEYNIQKIKWRKSSVDTQNDKISVIILQNVTLNLIIEKCSGQKRVLNTK